MDHQQHSPAPITRTVLIDQPLPAPLPVQRVEVRRIVIAPTPPAGCTGTTARCSAP
ncbi:hypothetical protein [Actinocatenispora sera]|uniref:Uncharacterized protein n=1 Tax=Actinocatenispora sera TaxID=390989 RepID=A0A810L5Y6_9ACTN|nr:hypothetical protein [Actinocatenispora sera]BCJ30499.1 hypothetical protein Asera_46070 [Actinocatenispora sera]